jgi:citrate lyase synthetase
VLIPQVTSAIAALAFSAYVFAAGHSFIERQAQKQDVMYLQNLMHLPAMR